MISIRNIFRQYSLTRVFSIKGVSDDPALPELRAAYYRLARSEPFSAFRDDIPVLPVWDDHDYGRNDAGADFALREESEALFEDVWALDADDPRRGRPGVYEAVTVGGTGAVELLACIMALRDGVIAPTIGYEEADPECALDVVPNEAREATVEAALSNAFAFGGLNAVLALTRA